MNNIDQAYACYENHIYNEDAIRLLTEHNLKVAGSVAPVLWELFGALLTGNDGNGVTGADLVGWEVKSAILNSSFEYQYHLNTGEHKLKEDCKVTHLFCAYSRNYENVIVKAIRGMVLAPIYFKPWVPLYRQNYNKTAPSEQRRQRFRKSISSGFVSEHGLPILEIKNGILIHRHDQTLDDLSDRK